MTLKFDGILRGFLLQLDDAIATRKLQISEDDARRRELEKQADDHRKSIDLMKADITILEAVKSELQLKFSTKS